MGTENQPVQSTAAAGTPFCDVCGSTDIDSCWRDGSFVHGIGTAERTIKVEVPWHHCRTCGLDYTDHEAEDIRHEALCRELGLLAPREIRGIRKKYGLSRQEFARITRLGKATLGRWERGALLQNEANDRYLRLLSHAENMEIVRSLAAGSDADCHVVRPVRCAIEAI